MFVTQFHSTIFYLSGHFLKLVRDIHVNFVKGESKIVREKWGCKTSKFEINSGKHK